MVYFLGSIFCFVLISKSWFSIIILKSIYISGVAVSKKSVSVDYGYLRVGYGSVTVSNRFWKVGFGYYSRLSSVISVFKICYENRKVTP